MSIKVIIYNQKAEQIGERKLSNKIFGVKTNYDLVHQAMVAQMSNQRQILAHTKDRGEVKGSGRKPWRQKGTGRARVGSIRSPIWIGGGITFGPRKNRNFKKDINKKMKQKAIFMVLSDKAANNNLILLDKLKMEEYKTKIFNEILNKLENRQQTILCQGREGQATDSRQQTADKIKRSLLIINDNKNKKIKYSGRNLPGVKIINLENINLLDLLKYKDLILTVNAVKKLEKQYTYKYKQYKHLNV